MMARIDIGDERLVDDITSRYGKPARSRSSVDSGRGSHHWVASRRGLQDRTAHQWGWLV